MTSGRGADRPAPAGGAPGASASWLRPVHGAIAVATLPFVALLALGPVPVVDLWWQMKAGQLIWEQGRVPHEDPFSCTATGREWIVQEWLPSLLFYALYTRVSPLALVLFKMTGAAVAFGLVLWRCLRRTDRPLLSALLTVLAAAAARTFLDIRPQIFSYVLFAGLLALLEEYRRQTPAQANAHRLLWPIPPILLLWANLHAGFLLGFLALGVYLIAEAGAALCGDQSRWRAVRALALVVAISAPLTLLQPNGIALWRYPFVLMGHPVVMDFILEWKSPDFHQPWTTAYAIFLLIALGAFALARRSIWTGDLFLLLILAYASLHSIRQIPLFVLAVTPALADAAADVLGRCERWRTLSIAALPTRRRREGGAGGALAAFGAAVALILLAYAFAVELQRVPRRDWFAYTGALHTFPIAACDAIEEHGWEGNLFNDYKWGGYLIWRFYPRRQVFIDGRAEVYFGAPFDDYYAIHNAFPDWDERLRKWRVATALLDRNAILTRVMEASPAWRRVYVDGVAVIYRRQTAAEANVLRRPGGH
jgi:hypothetical protein